MPLPARGLLYLGGVRFTCDPVPYEAYEWPKRMSEHPVIGNKVIIQDFGTCKHDLTITLGSGQNQYLEKSVVVALDAMYRTKGATYQLTDWLGNDMTVFIAQFKPTGTFLGTLFTYTMTLRVRAIAQLLGNAYTGL
jgi:hypothetical protein